jgi:hypothetical protein
MPDPGEIPDRLQFLLHRQSCAALGEPAPGADALRLIFQAALRGPDHLRLRPYAFIVAAGEGLNGLGAIMQRAAIAAGKPDDVVRRAPNMPRRAPMVIIVVASPKPHDLVPVFDQQLAAGCTVMTMQMAAQALGFGGIWRSGWFMYDRGMHREPSAGFHRSRWSRTPTSTFAGSDLLRAAAIAPCPGRRQAGPSAACRLRRGPGNAPAARRRSG